MNPFVERHQQEISGVLSCLDRVVVTGTLPDIGHAGAKAPWHEITDSLPQYEERPPGFTP